MGGILQVDTIQNNNATTIITQTNSTTLTFGVSGQNIVIPSGVTFNTASATVTLPAINLTTGVTGILPVANGGTNLSSGFANGITQADVFRVTTDFTGNATPIASNWERSDDASSGLIGTGMTQSSGIFSFPSTGIYLVTFIHNFYHTSDDRAVGNTINVSTDGGSTYDEVCEGLGFLKNVTPGTNSTDSATASALIDVTSTANVKVRFSVTKITAGTTTYGTTDSNRTFVTFIRLGDT